MIDGGSESGTVFGAVLVLGHDEGTFRLHGLCPDLFLSAESKSPPSRKMREKGGAPFYIPSTLDILLHFQNPYFNEN